MEIKVKPRIRPLTWVLFTVLPLVFAYIITHTTQPMGFGDAVQYMKMAEQPFQFTASPWGYRIVVPYLAALISNLLRIPLGQTFLFLSLLAFEAINMVIMIWSVRGLRLSIWTAVMLAMLYSFSYAGVYNLHNYIHIGFYWELLVFLGFLTIYYDRFPLLLMIVSLGSAVTENVIILIPTYFIYKFFTGNSLKAIVRTLILSAAFLAVFLLVRSGLLFKGSTGLTTYTHFYTLDYLKFVYNNWGGPSGAAKQVVKAFLLVWLIAALGFVHSTKNGRLIAALIPLAIVQIALATDVIRMTSIGFPAILMLVAFLFRSMKTYEQILATAMSIFSFYAFNLNIQWLLVLAITGLVILIWYVTIFNRRIIHTTHREATLP
jgi:hypothetical protein